MEVRNTAKGFTLIEIMIAMAIFTLLSLVIVPSYFNSVKKVRRLDAVSSLTSLQLQQAQWRNGHQEFGSLEELGWQKNSANSLDGHYTISMLYKDTLGFLASATPEGQQREDKCGVFAIDQGGAVYGDYADEGCWVR